MAAAEMAALKPVIRAILLVSAHWEEARPTVTSYSSPPPLTYGEIHRTRGCQIPRLSVAVAVHLSARESSK